MSGTHGGGAHLARCAKCGKRGPTKSLFALIRAGWREQLIAPGRRELHCPSCFMPRFDSFLYGARMAARVRKAKQRGYDNGRI